MLQRSPTYVVSRPDQDDIANKLRKVLPDGLAYDITRLKNTTLQQVIYKRTRTAPEQSKEQLLKMVRKRAGRRLRRRHALHADVQPVGPAAVPRAEQRPVRGDPVGQGLRRHRHDRHVHRRPGIRLASGDELEADIVVTATGLQLVTLGEMDIVVDGTPVDFSKTGPTRASRTPTCRTWRRRSATSTRRGRCAPT